MPASDGRCVALLSNCSSAHNRAVPQGGFRAAGGMRDERAPINADAFRDFERAAHDEIADGYLRFFTAVTDYAVEPLLDAAAVRAGRRVLDVATGPGVAAFRAASRGAVAVTGVDLAPRMLELAAAQYPRVDFRQADAESLPLDDHSFDCVVSNFGLGHFPRPERALSVFVRVLTPGGAVAVSWWDVPARHRVMGIFFDAINEVEPPRHGTSDGPAFVPVLGRSRAFRRAARGRPCGGHGSNLQLHPSTGEPGGAVEWHPRRDSQNVDWHPSPVQGRTGSHSDRVRTVGASICGARRHPGAGCV